MSLTVVYARDTGHVLGALALTGPAGPLPTLDVLVGGQLPLRVGLTGGKSDELPVPAARLAVAAVDGTSDVLVNPPAFGVDLASDGTPKPALLQLADWGSTPVAVGADGVTVNLPIPAPRDLPVLVLVSGGGAVRLLPAQIPSGRQKVTVAMTLVSGQEYGVLTLVQQWTGRLEALHW